MLKRKYRLGKHYKGVSSHNKEGHSLRKKKGPPTGPPGSPRGKPLKDYRGGALL